MPTCQNLFRRARLLGGIVICCSLLVSAPFDKKKKQSAAGAAPVIPDQALTVDDGRFVFRSLRFVQELSLVYLAGTVTNETSHDWEFVTFDLQWADSAGGTGTLGTAFCTSFPKQSECSLALGRSPGMMILGTPKNQYTAKFSLTNGHYIPRYSFSLQKPRVSEELAFEDPKVAFVARVSRQGIAVALLNKTDQPIRIDWNQVSYVDETGKANGVTHEGVKYTDASNSKPPTIIPPGSRHEDTIVPVGNIRYHDGWSVSPLFPVGEDSREIAGKTISMYLPMEISGKIESYSIDIKIESAN